MILSERIRIHLDWYGECRTCEFWKGDRADVHYMGECGNKESDMYLKDTTHCGHCRWWKTFDDESRKIAVDWDGQGTSPDVLLARKEKEKQNADV